MMVTIVIISFLSRHFGISSPSGQGVSMSKFLTVVGQLKFRGTSVLFRLPQSPVKRSGDPYMYPGRPTCPSPVPMRLFSPVHGPKDSKKTQDNEVEDMEVSETGIE